MNPNLLVIVAVALIGVVSLAGRARTKRHKRMRMASVWGQEDEPHRLDADDLHDIGKNIVRSMLEADLHDAIRDANDLGHFFLLMEHKGYEIRHGNRLGFRLRGQERFMVPGRKDPLFTEEGIRAAIQGNLSAIEAGRRPATSGALWRCGARHALSGRNHPQTAESAIRPG